MSDEWKKRDRPCEPCPDCGVELYEKFWGNGGWAKTDKATERTHDASDCVKVLKTQLAAATQAILETVANILMGELKARLDKAVDIGVRYGQIDGEHHKTWVIDQMLRALCGGAYDEVIRRSCEGEDGPQTYGWDTGIAP